MKATAKTAAAVTAAAIMGADWPEHEVDNARARVTAWSVDAPPQVMVVDLSKGTAAS